MRIVLLSDTHGLHDHVRVPDGDLLIHAGDLTTRGELEEIERFDRWLGRLVHRYKIVVAGNHDFAFERQERAARARITNACYLQDEPLTLEGVSFYGAPWQPWFYDWAFNLRRGPEIAAKWALIPDNVDVLITHGPPLGHGDMTRRREREGCEDLMKRVRAVKPRLHVFGHIHEGYGQSSEGGTLFANASFLDEQYRPANAPLMVDLDPRRREPLIIKDR